jgi:hypothetical protein
MMCLRRSIVSLAFVALAAGCAGRGAAPIVPAAGPVVAGALPHHRRLWGTALNGVVSVTIPDGLTDKVIKQAFCQVPKSICPLESDGLRSHSVTASKSASWGSNAYSASTAASSALGATSTLSGNVGQTLNIEGDGAISSSLCQTVGCIPQSAKLEGTVKYTIVPITKGAGFTTASGASYK